MSQIASITGAADKARDDLREQLGGDAASVALALALGKLCAESGVSLSEAIAVVEIAHRESKLELDARVVTAA